MFTINQCGTTFYTMNSGCRMQINLSKLQGDYKKENQKHDELNCNAGCVHHFGRFVQGCLVKVSLSSTKAKLEENEKHRLS